MIPSDAQALDVGAIKARAEVMSFRDRNRAVGFVALCYVLGYAVSLVWR